MSTTTIRIEDDLKVRVAAAAERAGKAAFVATPGGETLLAGFYGCRYLGLNDVERSWPHTDGLDPVGTCDVYELAPDDRLNDLAGRLVIAWGDAERAWIQRADRQDKDVLELRQAFREADFPGFTRFISSLCKIEELPATWIAALSSSPAPAMTGRQRQWVKLFDTWYNLGPQRRSRPRLGSAAIFGICRSTALVTGMVVDTYVMRRLRKLVPTGKAHFDWHVAPRNAGELLVWEAFVTNQKKP